MPIITAQAELPKSQPLENRQSDTVIEPAPKEATLEQDGELSPKFAALARKEKAMRAQAQALKAKEDALKAQEAEYSSKYVPKDRLIKETLAVLSENGISYEQLTNAILNGPAPQDVANQKLEAKIKELEERLTKQATSAEEQQKTAYEQAIGQIRNEAKILVDSDPAFETIKDTNNTEAVVELIERTYQEEKVVLSVSDAAKQVEEYLIDEAMKMTQLKKVKEKLTPPPQEASKQQTKLQPQIKTLTNAVSASSTKPLSTRDRVERAKAAFRGELK